MISQYVNGLLSVPPRDVAEIFTDSVGVLCLTFLEEQQLVSTWVVQAMQNVPINVLTLENRELMVQTVSNVAEFRLSRLHYELNLLAKRARSSAIRQ